MYLLRIAMLLVVALSALFGCAKKTVQPAPSVVGEHAKAGALLAYDHTIRIDLSDDSIAARIDSVRDACASEQLGACSLLSVEQSSGSGTRGEIVVRIVPSGVEPMVRLAANGGVIETRLTSAEDLAEAVADTARQRDLLMRQRVRLEEFQARKDLAVADMLALSRELAAIEVQIDAAAKESAKQQRRIETNRVTIGFAARHAESGVSRIVDALKNLWSSFVEGIADALEYFGYALPFLVLGFALLLILRWIWRKLTR